MYQGLRYGMTVRAKLQPANLSSIRSENGCWMSQWDE